MLSKRIAKAALLGSLALSGQAWADRPRLEFWTQSLAPKFAPYFNNLVSRYQAANPQVEVAWVDYPWDVIRSKFMVALASGNPPALANVQVPWVYEFKEAGLIQPLDNLLDSKQYLTGAIMDVSFDGHIYAFPFYNGANVIAYNTALFRQAGLDPAQPPRSFDMQLSYAKTIRQKTGVAGFAPTLGPTKVEGLMINEGLEIMRNGRAVFNSPAHVAFVRKLADAYQAGALLKDNLFSEDNFQVSMAAYNSGRLGMLVTVPAALKRVRDDAPAIYRHTDAASAPLGRTGMAAGGWQFTFVVPKNVDPKLLPEVAKLGAFLTSAENQLAFSRAAGTLPTSRLASQHAFFHTLPDQAGAVEKGLIAAARNIAVTRTVFLAGVKNSELLSTRLSGAVEQAVTGRKDAKLALDEAVLFWNKKLGK
ncbi:extracellular solute-binding protein [Chitinimonas arctica]|uniref:Extracellular solute-binding protein n=1 Tax=Chitinimonas arctica TaxID=2594795 RepID=A0A516SDW8_9NEIS|nr:extracellular solute-binding protein [Chitinimonas arctica]QDQ26330.1 extracellular solute-binding protein [Chitinimonas arctica]